MFVCVLPIDLGRMMRNRVLTKDFNHVNNLIIINNLIIRLKNMDYFRSKTCTQCNKEFRAFNGMNDNICGTECRFWSKVDKIDDENSCWLWNSSVGKDGYANIRNGGNSSRAHRYSYETNVGSIPEGKFICHKCDVRHCVRPDHLFIGDYRTNAEDCAKKGRNKRRLSQAQVELILDDKRSNRELSDEFNICASAISTIKNGKTWKWIITEKIPVGQAKGEKSGTAKLTELQVISIRNDQRKLREIAKDYNVSHGSISRIKIGKGWKHNEAPLDIRGTTFGYIGEDSNASKLTEEQVITIRLDTRNNTQIAKNYNVGRKTIANIKNGVTWSHITTELRVRDKSLNILRGSNHPRFKYSDEMILDIRNSTKSRKALAAEYNVTEMVIKNLRNKYYRLTKDKGGVARGVATDVDFIMQNGNIDGRK